MVFEIIKADTCVFRDEERLKTFVSLTENQKDLCEEEYNKNTLYHTVKPQRNILGILWKINTTFTESYINDYMEIKKQIYI